MMLCLSAQPPSESGGGNLELLDRIFREVGQRPSHHLVVIVSAIDRNIAAAPKAAGGTYLKGVGLGWVKGGAGRFPRNQIGQFKEVPAVERNAVDRLRSDLTLDHGLCQIHGLN